MAGPASVLDTLTDFTTACKSTTNSIPSPEVLVPPENGISLLDTKNEIFLSYLQALALRNLNVIRSLRDGGSIEDAQTLSDEVTMKLVEHRVYLERGIRPLEQKLKYQTDKVVKAAANEDRLALQKLARNNDVNGHANRGAEEESSGEDEDDEDSETENTTHRAAFSASDATAAKSDRHAQSKEDGVYRPPRVAATSMPTTERKERKERRSGRSATLDEYVNTELSAAPTAEPSIGSTIAQGGRKTKDARQLAKEQERRDYEETHLMRLPKESKKELAQQRARDSRGGYGGEEWSGLGAAVDRIGELTKRKGKSKLESSRKRAIEDGPRNDGVGGDFDAKRRRVVKKTRR